MADLDLIAARAGRAAPFDVSPRGVTVRPDPELDSLLDALGEDDVPALAARLQAEEDPFTALLWIAGLVRVGTPAARAALDAYAERLRGEDPWPGTFPGRREVLLYLGVDG